jgi:hypothetical protein
MERFTLEIETGNDALQTGEDLARLLVRFAENIREGNGFGSNPIRDDNGNAVGSWSFVATPR